MEHSYDRGEQLEEELKRQRRILAVPGAREDVRRDCITKVLQAAASFLISWENVSDDKRFLSLGIVRDALSMVFSEVGPGDSQVRGMILETLPALSNADARQVMLDALPYTVPVADSRQQNDITREVISVIRELLMKDAGSLLPILGCLSNLPLSDEGRSEAWNLSVASLPFVEESELPVVIQTLLCHVSTIEEASAALKAMRSEMRLVDEADQRDRNEDSVPLVANALLNALHDKTTSSVVAQAYLSVLNSMVESADEISFLLLDVIALLVLFHRDELKDDVSQTMDRMLQMGEFPFSSLNRLLPMLNHKHRAGEPSSQLYDALAPPLMSLAVWMLLLPVRRRMSDTNESRIIKFTIQLCQTLDRFRQEEIVRCLFHLKEESSWYTNDAEQQGRRQKRRQSRIEGMHKTEQIVSRILQDLSSSSRDTVLKFKHLLTERLTSTSTQVSTNDDIRSVQQICAILSCLVQSETSESSGINVSELMILLQKLLFTSSVLRSSRAFGNDEAGNMGRIIRGLILAMELVKSPYVSMGDKDCVYHWVHRIMVPTTRRTIDPAVGRLGLRFLREWRTRQSGPSATDLGSRQKEIFQTVKQIIANTGLVQVLAPYLQQKRPNLVVAFSQIPSFLLPSKRKIRSMIFCATTFHRYTDMPPPSRWEDMVQWVFSLVDDYLSMGRKSSSTGWAPDGWLAASIELQNFAPLVRGDSRKSAVFGKWIEENLGTFQVSFDLPSPVLQGALRDVAELFVFRKEMEEVREETEALLRLGLSCCVALTLSAAVLRNAFEHYRYTSKGSSPDTRPNQILNLMQYQLIKVFHMRGKTLLVSRMMKSIARAFRKEFLSSTSDSADKQSSMSGDDRVDEPMGTNEQQPDNFFDASAEIPALLETAAEKIISITHDVCETSRYIEEDTAWACLCSSGLDAGSTRKVKDSQDPPESLRFSLMSEFVSTTFLSVVLKRKCISLSKASFRNGISHCGRVIFPVSNSLKDVHHGSPDPLLSIVSASYINLVSTLLQSAYSSDAMGAAVHLLYEAVSSPENSDDKTGSAKSKMGDSLVYVFDSSFERLRLCVEVSPALGFLDILACLAWTDRPFLLDRAVGATWKALLTIFSTSNQATTQWQMSGASGPFSFTQVIASIAVGIPDRAVQATLVRSAERQTKEFTACCDLRFLLLSFWGLMMHPNVPETYATVYLSKLIDALETFLDGFISEGPPRKTRSGSSKRQSSSPSRISKRTRSRPFSSFIPGLTASSFAVFFEMILHMTVASFAVLGHARIRHGQNRGQNGPFDHLQTLLMVYGRVLELFMKRFNVFPRRMVGVVHSSCKQMLNLCIFHAHGCVQWRNSQPLLSAAEKRAGKHDYGAIRYLDIVLQYLTAAGVGKILSLCDFVRLHSGGPQKSDAVSDNEDEDNDDDESDNEMDAHGELFGVHHNKFSSLMLSAQKVVVTLKDVASKHNLAAPSIRSDVVDNHVGVDLELFDIDDKGFHDDLKRQTAVAVESDSETEDIAKPKRRRRVTTVVLEDDEDFEVEGPEQKETVDRRLNRPKEVEREWSEYKQGDRNNEFKQDSFAADGHWGGDDASATAATSDIELSVSDIVHTA